MAAKKADSGTKTAVCLAQGSRIRRSYVDRQDTKDIVPPHYDEYGILTVNIYDFLLESDCLER